MMNKKLKLNALAAQNLSETEMNRVRGGATTSGRDCGCGCAYANNGGSSTIDNALANYKNGLVSLKTADAGMFWLSGADPMSDPNQ